MSISDSDNVDKEQTNKDYSNQYGDETNDDYDSGESEYFGPLQPVKSADQQKVFQVPPGGWQEKLVQQDNVDQTQSSGSEQQQQQETTNRVVEASVLSSALIILIIIVVICCCLLPCCYYLLYDPAVAKGIRSFYKGARKRARKVLDAGLDSPSAYKKFRKDSDRRKYSERRKDSEIGKDSMEKGGRESRKNKHNKKNSRRHGGHGGHGRTIEIPIPSDESVDITIITSTDEGITSDEDCQERRFIGSELDVMATDMDDDDFNRKFDHITDSECPFEPTHKTNHKTYNNTNYIGRSHKHSKNRDSLDYYDPLSFDVKNEIYSRYNDAVDNIYHNEIPVHHNQRRDSHNHHRHHGLDNHGDRIRIPVPTESEEEESVLNKIQQSVQQDMDFKKAKKYDDMISEWKFKNSSTNAEAVKSSLGPPPPPRKNHKKSLDNEKKWTLFR